MKIKGKAGSQDVPILRDIAQQDAVRIHTKQKGAPQAAEEREDTPKARGISGEDRVTVGVGHLINAELNPAAMAAERRKRIEEIKQLLAEGKYNPPVSEIAKAVSEEIATEILLAPPEEPGTEEEE